MKFSIYLKKIAVCSLVTGMLLSCEKTKEVDDIGDDGHTIVKLVGGGTNVEPGFNTLAIDFVAEPTSIIGADIRRDIPNNAELNRPMVVTVKDDLAAIDAANAADPDLHLEHLDPSWYTVGASTPKTGGAGGTYTVTLNPGEFAKNIDIIITDATVLDPSSKYGLAFTIMTADADGQIAVEGKTIILEIGAKNQFDGKYSGKGYGNLGGNTLAPYLFNFDCSFGVELTTTGANSVDMNAQPLFRTPGETTAGFSNVIPKLTFDPSTLKVIAVTPADGIPNSISFQFPVDGGTYDSRFDPATKTIYVRYGLNNNATWRVVDTLTWCGSR